MWKGLLCQIHWELTFFSTGSFSQLLAIILYFWPAQRPTLQIKSLATISSTKCQAHKLIHYQRVSKGNKSSKLKENFPSANTHKSFHKPLFAPDRQKSTFLWPLEGATLSPQIMFQNN